MIPLTPRKTNDTSDEKANRTYYKIFYFIQVLIFMIHFVIVFSVIQASIIIISFYDSFWVVVGCVLFGIIGVYVLGWAFCFPLRVFLYKISKKQGLLKQEFRSWLVDWLMLLAINLVMNVPFYTIVIVFMIYQFSKPFWEVALSAGLCFAALFFWAHFYSIVTIAFIHGIFKLKEGEKYEYWKTFVDKTARA